MIRSHGLMTFPLSLQGQAGRAVVVGGRLHILLFCFFLLAYNVRGHTLEPPGTFVCFAPLLPLFLRFHRCIHEICVYHFLLLLHAYRDGLAHADGTSSPLSGSRSIRTAKPEPSACHLSVYCAYALLSLLSRLIILLLPCTLVCI